MGWTAQISPISTKKMALIQLTVTCGKESVNVEVCPDDFQFIEFDSWLRSRFLIEAGEKVVFQSEKGLGIVMCTPIGLLLLCIWL
jgi:hypothetical protein